MIEALVTLLARILGQRSFAELRTQLVENIAAAPAPRAGVAVSNHYR